MELPKRARTANWESGVLTLDREQQFEVPALTLELMERLNFSQEEIKEYRRKHWMFSAVRGMEIQENLERGNMSEAIRVLQESKILDKEYPGLAAGYSEQLISIYEKP